MPNPAKYPSAYANTYPDVSVTGSNSNFISFGQDVFFNELSSTTPTYTFSGSGKAFYPSNYNVDYEFYPNVDVVSISGSVQTLSTVIQPVTVSGPVDISSSSTLTVTVSGPVTLSSSISLSGAVLNSAITIDDGPNLDAFSRLRVSDAQLLFAVQHQYGLSQLKMEYGNSGSGVMPVWESGSRMVKLSTLSGSGLSYTQSHQYLTYQPGRSQQIFITGVLGSSVNNSTKEFGYFDSYNGIFLRQSPQGIIQFVRRTSTSGVAEDFPVDQDDWNIDKLNGSGSSGYTLNTDNVFILVIDLQFLAMGRVRMGFDIGGKIIYCHEFLHANILTVPYMQTATLPVCAQITSNSSPSTANSYFKCTSVSSEGGVEKALGYDFVTPESSVTAIQSARTPVIALRPRTTFNGQINRAQIYIEGIEMAVTGNQPVTWELAVGATYNSGPSWIPVNSTYSSFECGLSGSFSTLDNGVVIASGYIPSSNQTKGQISSKVAMSYPITLDRAGGHRSLGTLTLFATGINGDSAVRGRIAYTEIR